MQNFTVNPRREFLSPTVLIGIRSFTAVKNRSFQFDQCSFTSAEVAFDISTIWLLKNIHCLKAFFTILDTCLFQLWLPIVVTPKSQAVSTTSRISSHVSHYLLSVLNNIQLEAVDWYIWYSRTIYIRVLFVILGFILFAINLKLMLMLL